MKYFVSLEKDAYHDWQAELLIESFNNIALIDDLYMTTNVTEKNRYPHLLNLLKHKNLFTFDDVGEMKGFRPINELYQLTTLIMDKAVSFPLVVMKPHVIMKEKIEKIVEINEARAFVYGVDPYFTFDNATKNCENFWECCEQEESYYKENWFNLGSVFLMIGLPDWIVNKVIKVAESLIIKQISDKKPVWKDTCKLAWIISMCDLKKHIEIIYDQTLSSIMNDGKNTVFIDYEHGLPPDFNKLMFKYEPPACLSFGDPIENMSNLISTPNAHFISKLALLMLRKRKLNASSLKK